MSLLSATSQGNRNGQERDITNLNQNFSFLFDCGVIIVTKLVKKSCEFLIDFAVLANVVSHRFFEALLLKGVNCACQHTFPIHLQLMNCFHNINILYYL